MWTVSISRISDDPYDLWDGVRGEFGHVDDGGALYGISTGSDGIRLHFVAHPTEEQIAAIKIRFDVESVQCEKE